MRKPRVLFIVFTTSLAALLFGSWWQRDIVASQLVNLFSGNMVIQQLFGLELGFREVSIEQVRLKSWRGSSLVLDRIKIVYPLHIIYDWDNTQKIELSVEKLTLDTSKEENSTGQSIPLKNPTLPLSSLTQDIVRYMPGDISIKKIVFNNKLIAGPLDINRRENTITVELPYSSTQLGNLHFSLQAVLSSTKVEINAKIYSTSSEIISQAEINLLKEERDNWEFNARVTSNLEAITPRLSIAPKENKTYPRYIKAAGLVILNASSRIPDTIGSFSDYQNIVLRLESENLEATLPSNFLKNNLRVELATALPIEVKLKSLTPLIAESITGSGIVKVSSETSGSDETPILDLEFESVSQNNASSLLTNGTLYLAASKALFESPQWKKYAPSLSVNNPQGEIKFQGEGFLQPLGAPFTAQTWLQKFQLLLLPESQLKFDIFVPNLPESSPLDSTGLNQSHVQVEVREKVKIVLGPSSFNPVNFEITQGAVAVKLQAESSTSSVLTQIKELQCRFNNSAECSFLIDVKAPELLSNLPEVDIVNFNSKAKVYYQKNNNAQKLRLKQAKVSVEKIKGNGYQVEEGELQIPAISCKIEVQTASCNSDRWSGQFKALASEYFTLSGGLNFNSANLKIDQGGTQITSHFEGRDIRVNTPENYSLDTSLKGSFSLSGDQIVGETQLIANSIKIDSDWRHNIEKATGTVSFSLPKVSLDTGHPLSQTFQGLPVDLVSGELSGSGIVSWPTQQEDILKLTLTDIAAVYGDSFATGIDGKLLVKSDNGFWVTPKPQPLSIKSIDSGLPLEKVHFSLSLDKKQDLTLKNFSAEFLAGKVISEALTWNLEHKVRHSTLYAQGVSLEQLADETESGNFGASGRLNLTIPIVTGPEGITVEKGHLEALAPGGQLRYYSAFSPQMLANNPQLKSIANALEDYDFRSLEGSVQYPPSGDLQMNLKLVGHSESVDSGRDLIINLNLENNIPAMLRSLQASRNLTEALEKQLDQ